MIGEACGEELRAATQEMGQQLMQEIDKTKDATERGEKDGSRVQLLSEGSPQASPEIRIAADFDGTAYGHGYLDLAKERANSSR